MRAKPTALLFLALFNSILGLSLLFPILAPLGRMLELSELEIGSLSGAYALMQLLFSPYWGRRSERVGRKPVMLTGILGFALSFFAFGAVAQLGLGGVLRGPPLLLLLLATRAVGGWLSSATLPTAQAYIADVTDRDGRTSGMALVGAAFGLAVIVGPALGAALSLWSLLTPVYVSASLALFNALFVWWRLPESPRRTSSSVPARLGWTDGRVRSLLAVGLVATLSSVAMEQTLAFYFQDRLSLSLAMTPRYVGAALVVYGLVVVLVQGVLIRRYHLAPSLLLKLGPPLAMAGFAGLLLSHHFASLTASLAFQGLGHGLVMPGVTAALSLSVSDGEQGAVAGLNSSSQALARLLGPLVGTGLYELDPRYPYLVALALLGALILVLPRRIRMMERMAHGATEPASSTDRASTAGTPPSS
jgi:MFS family permease